MGFKAFAALVMVLLFCCGASAGLLVDVSPKDPSRATLSLYQNESADYSITVFNSGPEEAKNVLVKANTAPGLMLVENGIEKDLVSAAIESIPPNSRETVLVTLRPVEQTSKKLLLYVEYGLGEYTHLNATYLSVLESPLEINTSLSSTALDLQDEGKVKLSFKNRGSEPVRNIKADLIAFQGLESMNGSVQLALLQPGEGYEAKEFLFRPEPTASGKQVLVMQVSFEDSLGKHVIERALNVEIQSRQTILYAIIIIIVLLVAVAFLSRRKEPGSVKKLEKPIVDEIEGKKVSKGKS
jgi:hypothetical protein